MTAVTTAPIAVAAADSVPHGQPITVDVGGRPVVLVRTDEGWLAVDGTCSHAGAPLGEGTTAGCVLVCPWHSSAFDLRSGAPQRGPARRPLRAYAVSVHDGVVHIHVDHLED